LVTSRFSPAIAAVGESFFGQRSVQLTWLWQAWQPVILLVSETLFLATLIMGGLLWLGI